jgi:hypothetical protein
MYCELVHTLMDESWNIVFVTQVVANETRFKMETENQMEKIEKPEVRVETVASGNRRRLIQSALVGVPVLLALKSTPVLACNSKSPSGFSTSGNLSHNGGNTGSDPAKGPAYWLGHITSNQFTGTGISTNTKFNDIFKPSSNSNSFLSVLNSLTNLESLIVAAYLDVKSGTFVPGVSELDIKMMWNGSYKPNGGTSPWKLAESENYLRYTMGLPLNS